MTGSVARNQLKKNSTDGLYEEEKVPLFSETLFLPTLRVSTNSSALWIYRFRYWFIRTFASPAWHSPPAFLRPIIGGKSFIELFVVFVCYVILVAAVRKNEVHTSGAISSAVTGVAILFGLRNNVLTLLFSISFERALYFHKMFAILCLVVSTFHTVYSLMHSTAMDTVNISGIALMAIMVAMSLMYVAKHLHFEVFYFFHVTMFTGVITIVAAFVHNANILAWAMVYWGFDLVVRYALTVKKVQATAELLPANVVRIRFPKKFDYAPGQYCFIMIPSLSVLQFHPFTISSAPHEMETKFHIRALGNWTESLKNLVIKGKAAGTVVKKNSQSTTKQHATVADVGVVGVSPVGSSNGSDRVISPSSSSSSPSSLATSGGGGSRGFHGLPAGILHSIPLEVVIEGPYGIPSVDLMSPDYKVHLFITGGIGVTPAQCMFNSLIHAYSQGHRPDLRKCIFIWSVKDKVMVDSTDTDRHEDGGDKGTASARGRDSRDRDAEHTYGLNDCDSDSLHDRMEEGTAVHDRPPLRSPLPLSFQPDLLSGGSQRFFLSSRDELSMRMLCHQMTSSRCDDDDDDDDESSAADSAFCCDNDTPNAEDANGAGVDGKSPKYRQNHDKAAMNVSASRSPIMKIDSSKLNLKMKNVVAGAGVAVVESSTKSVTCAATITATATVVDISTILETSENEEAEEEGDGEDEDGGDDIESNLGDVFLRQVLGSSAYAGNQLAVCPGNVPEARATVTASAALKSQGQGMRNEDQDEEEEKGEQQKNHADDGTGTGSGAGSASFCRVTEAVDGSSGGPRLSNSALVSSLSLSTSSAGPTSSLNTSTSLPIPAPRAPPAATFAATSTTRAATPTSATPTCASASAMADTDDNNNSHIDASRQPSFSFQQDVSSEDRFHGEFYITSLRNKADFHKANIDPVKQPYLRFGRPNLPDIFARVTQLCAKEGIERVAVVSCGPAPMVQEVSALCGQRGRLGGVKFDLHLEEFDF